MVPRNTDVFAKVMTMGKKQILARLNWNQKRKMWEATHFSAVIKQP